MARPDFFIVGAARCGTTAMNGYLSSHPEIFISPVKEMHHFGSDFNTNSPYRDRELYLSTFEGARDEKRVGEASVWYLYSTTAAREIKEFNPDSRIIIMLRNPVDMIYSLHSKLIALGYEDIYDFTQALAAEESRKQGRRLAKGAYPPVILFYREHVKYARAVERYLETFGRDRVLVIIYDDFQADILAAYRRTLEFLGVDPDHRPEFPILNQGTQARLSLLDRLLRRPPPLLMAIRRALVPAWLHPGRLLMTFNTRRGSVKPLDPALRKKLQAEFEPEVLAIGDLLGRDLSHWNRV